LIDPLSTNIFLELVLDQKRADECENLLDLVSKGQTEATVSDFSVHAVEPVIPDTRSHATFLANLEHSVGLSIHYTSLSDEIAAALISQKVSFLVGVITLEALRLTVGPTTGELGETETYLLRLLTRLQEQPHGFFGLVFDVHCLNCAQLRSITGHLH
jgi:hypothetical protein